jgi:hypothetical protein
MLDLSLGQIPPGSGGVVPADSAGAAAVTADFAAPSAISFSKDGAIQGIGEKFAWPWSSS